MATLNIRNFPDDLHAMLKERARRNRRSLNQEVIKELSRVEEFGAGEALNARVEREIREAAELRGRVRGFLSAVEIDEAKQDGRA